MAHLLPSSIITPMELEITFKVGPHTHVLTLKVEKGMYYRDFGEAGMRRIYNDLHTFLSQILVEAPPGTPAPPGIPPPG